ncbi:MAG TPA: hypothetical protein VNN22_07490, partial [Verrucomicrobiae bacterium]|nr:hypothetical protein [Verrucomicrobiae bacterium]
TDWKRLSETKMRSPIGASRQVCSSGLCSGLHPCLSVSIRGLTASFRLSRNAAEEPHAKAAKTAKGRAGSDLFTRILNPYSAHCFCTQEFSFLRVLGGLGVREVSLGPNRSGLES